MSRAGQACSATGDLDEVAIYNRALSAATIAEHYDELRHEPPPGGSLHRHAEPGERQPDGHLQRLDLERSRRLDHQVRVGPRRQRHLRDRHGHDARRRRAATRPRAPSTSSLRVTDNLFGTDTETKTLTSATRRPTAVVHASTPNPAHHRRSGRLQRLRHRPMSTAPSPSTSGTSTATAPTRPTPGRPRRRRAPTRRSARQRRPARHRQRRQAPATVDAAGDDQRRRRQPATATPCSTRPACVNYWRMGEAAGPTFADSKGTSHATAFNGADLRRRPAPSPAIRTRPGASTASTTTRRRTSTCPARRRATVEFWLKWDAVRATTTPRDGVHAELQRQRRRLPGRPGRRRSSAGSFGVGIGRRRLAQQRLLHPPAAGTWHHYAFVMDTSPPAAHADHALSSTAAP